VVVVDAGADFFALLLGQCVPGGGFDVVAAVFFQVQVGFATQQARANITGQPRLRRQLV